MMRFVIAVVVVLVLAAGVILYKNNSGGSAVVQTPPATPSNASVDNSDVIVKTESHVFNCAEPDYLEAKWKDPKTGNEIVVLEKIQWSEGEVLTALHSPKWVNKCNLDDIKEKPGALGGLAIYKFETQRDDTFYVSLRAKWTDTCGNSCWILMDGPATGGHSEKDGQYYMIEDEDGKVKGKEKDYEVTWHPLKKAGKPLPFQLKKGQHTIEIHTREDGPRFDQLVVSTDANTPVGVLKTK